MSILRTIKQNTFLNRIFRSILRTSSRGSQKLHSFLINRWTTSGVIDCTFGDQSFKYFNRCDDGHPHYFYYDLPYHEKADLELFIELAMHSETIVDIGANTGLFSVLAGLKNKNAQIHAIEPYHVNAERMKVNFALNGLKNIHPHQLAIGDKEGELELFIPESGAITDVSSFDSDLSKNYYPDVKMKGHRVKVKTLDDFAKENNLKVNLIKCDVECFEMEVFKGSDRILREDRPTIIFECLLDDERRNFFNELLKKYDYHVYLIFEQGVVSIPEGFVNIDGLNYLLSPVKPKSSFIRYSDKGHIVSGLLSAPSNAGTK